MLKIQLHLADTDAMLALGQNLARAVFDNTALILLQGELGAGKTTLVRGFLQGLGYHGKVKSPTYTLVEPYQINDKTVYHFDFYRIHQAAELTFIGLNDYLVEQAICLIEWPERGAELLPTPDLLISIEVLTVGRELTIQSGSQCGTHILEQLHVAPAP